MMAIAQKKRVYIYDNAGIEIHCLRNHLHPNALEFLPYHFLLVTLDGKRGMLRYHDISIGQTVAEHKMQNNSGFVLRQNPTNAVIGVGHANGQVSMWTPNLSKPAIKIQCHPSSISGIAFDYQGRYMCTSGMDCRVRIWDLRKFGMLHEFFTVGSSAPESIDISQRGLLGVSCGNIVQVWKGWDKEEKPKAPYMKHQIKGNNKGTEIQFAPYEDFLGIGHSGGFSSIVVPGSGESNIDSFEANPYEGKKQKQEALVRSLLEKLPADMISLEVDRIGMIDNAAEDVKEKEKKEALKELEEAMWKKKKKRVKEDTIDKTHKEGVIIKQRIRAKNRDIAKKLYETKLKEHADVEKDLEFLNQIEGKFDPLKSLLTQKDSK